MSVCGTGTMEINNEAFLGSLTPLDPICRSFRSCSYPSLTVCGFSCTLASILKRTFKTLAQLHLLRHSEGQTLTSWYGNINPLCIGYSLRPRLSSRLTLSRRTLLRKPYPFGDMDFDHVYRYLSLNFHFQPLHLRSRLGFGVVGTLSYHPLLDPRFRLDT